MKIAIFSDIHGNMQALNKVLEDIQSENCDKIFCLGDLAMAGPEPSKTVEQFIELAKSDNFHLIQGNTDEMIANYSDELGKYVKEQFPIMGEALEDDVKLLSDEQKLFLKNLPKQLEIEILGTKILLVHGSPRKNNENIFPDLPIEKIEEMLSETDADLIFCGHTHVPCAYQTRTKQTVVNDGSVGRPFTPNAMSCYVVADFSQNSFEISHKFVDYDKVLASNLLKNRNFKGADKLAEMLIKPVNPHI